MMKQLLDTISSDDNLTFGAHRIESLPMLPEYLERYG